MDPPLALQWRLRHCQVSPRSPGGERWRPVLAPDGHLSHVSLHHEYQGVDARTIMETLGHSTIGMTMNLYAHVLPSLQRDAADRMDALLAARAE